MWKPATIEYRKAFCEQYLAYEAPGYAFTNNVMTSGEALHPNAEWSGHPPTWSSFLIAASGCALSSIFMPLSEALWSNAK
jgi:hypothetical protein